MSEGRARHATCAAFIEAGVQAGLPATDDFNGPSQDGVGWYQVTQRDGLRCSAAVAYLHPALERPNLRRPDRCLRHPPAARRDPGRWRGDRSGQRASGDPRRRDHPQRGVLPEPADPAPERDRPRRGARAGWDSRQWSTCRWAGDCRITRRPGSRLPTDEPSLLTAETEENLALVQTEGRGPLTSNFAESGGFMRTRDDLEAPDIQLHAVPILFPEAGCGGDPGRRLGAVGLPAAPQSAGLCQAPLPGPHLQAADPAQLPGGGERPGDDGRGGAPLS